WLNPSHGGLRCAIALLACVHRSLDAVGLAPTWQRADDLGPLRGGRRRNARSRKPNQKECAMKLNSAQVERTLSQFQAEAIPDDHPVVRQLNDLFGEHTFFLDSAGLNIVEPTGTEPTGTQSAKVINLANWSEANPSRLEPHEPEMTDVVVVLDSKH